MKNTVIRYSLAVAAAVLALPGVARASEVAAQVAKACGCCCGGC